jgi:hypothetical protein
MTATYSLDTNSDSEDNINENEGRDMGIHKAKEIPLDETQALSPYMLGNTNSLMCSVGLYFINF